MKEMDFGYKMENKIPLNEEEIESYIKTSSFNVATGEYDIDSINRRWLRNVAKQPFDIQMQQIRSYMDGAQITSHFIIPCLLRIIIVAAIIYGIVKACS